MLPSDFIEKVKENTDIVQLIGEHVTLKSSGRNMNGLCPFHNEKTPSFMVNPERQIFKCFGCGEGGNAIHFVMKFQKMEFIPAVEYLAERAGLEVPRQAGRENLDKAEKDIKAIREVNQFARDYFHQVLMKNPRAESARKYLFEKRKLTPETVVSFRLGYSLPDWDSLLKEAGRQGFNTYILEKAGLIIARQSGSSGYYDRFRDQVMFPITDSRGFVIGFGGRFLDAREPKYLNSPETPVFTKSRCLYALEQAQPAIKELGKAVLMEGYMDVLSAHQHGVRNAVATLGTALTREHAKLLRRYCPEAVLMYDADKAGLSAALRGLEPLLSLGLEVRVASIPEGKDPDEYLQSHSLEEFQKVLAMGQDPVEFALELVIAQHGLYSVTAKTRVIDEMQSILERMGQPVEKDLYIQIIANRIGLDRNTLLRQFRQNSKKPGTVVHPGVDSLEIRRRGETRIERELLKLLVFNPGYITAIQEVVKDYVFATAVGREAIIPLLACDDPSTLRNADDVLNYLQDIPAAVKWVTEIMMEDPLSNSDDYLTAFRRKITKLRLDREINELQAHLRQAEKAGDLKQVTLLQEKILEIKKTALSISKVS